jgi:hypothetical protein
MRAAGEAVRLNGQLDRRTPTFTLAPEFIVIGFTIEPQMCVRGSRLAMLDERGHDQILLFSNVTQQQAEQAIRCFGH